MRIPAKKGDAPYFQAVVASLSQCEGVVRLEANPLTGSVLVVTRGEDIDLGRVALEKNLFSLTRLQQDRRPFYEMFLQAFQQLDLRMKEFSGGGMDLTGLTFLGLLTMGVLQLMEGNFMVPAFTAFWYAMTLLMEVQPVPPASS